MNVFKPNESLTTELNGLVTELEGQARDTYQLIFEFDQEDDDDDKEFMSEEIEEILENWENNLEARVDQIKGNPQNASFLKGYLKDTVKKLKQEAEAVGGRKAFGTKDAQGFYDRFAALLFQALSSFD